MLCEYLSWQCKKRSFSLQMLKFIQSGRQNSAQLLRAPGRVVSHNIVNPCHAILSQQTSPITTTRGFRKEIYQESFAKRKKEQRLVPDSDPFGLPVACLKAVACGLVLATVIGIATGCYNSKFRAELRTTFPYAALWVDFIKGEEKVEEQRKNESSTINDSPFDTELRAGMLEVKKD